MVILAEVAMAKMVSLGGEGISIRIGWSHDPLHQVWCPQCPNCAYGIRIVAIINDTLSWRRS